MYSSDDGPPWNPGKRNFDVQNTFLATIRVKRLTLCMRDAAVRNTNPKTLSKKSAIAMTCNVTTYSEYSVHVQHTQQNTIVYRIHTPCSDSDSTFYLSAAFSCCYLQLMLINALQSLLIGQVAAREEW
jgi:sRNA-binding regulator protein Hfq